MIKLSDTKLLACYDPTENGTRELHPTENIWFVDDGFYAWIYAIVQSTLGIVTIIGNLLVIGSVYSIPKIERGLHQYGKASLATADLLLGVTIICRTAWEIITSCPLPKYFVDFMWFKAALTILMCVSFLHLTMLSMFRYRAITQPFQQAKICYKKCIQILTALWFGSTAAACIILSMGTMAPAIVILGVIPYLLTIGSTFAMYCAYRRKSYSQYDGPMPQCVMLQLKEENLKIVKTLCSVVFGYSLTYVPFLVYVSQRLVDRSYMKSFCIIKNFQATLMLSNGIVDVIVYSSMDEHFQDFIKSFLLWLFCRKNSQYMIQSNRSTLSSGSHLVTTKLSSRRKRKNSICCPRAPHVHVRKELPLAGGHTIDEPCARTPPAISTSI